ncbi:C45 family autoproteolytic acyltransferase/hydolase [Erwinia psidii]|uniref:Acyl-CoA--6-aminopenicillanic acid acyl-transferase n=1 Tax=Erwinia psidii TaxID=69224 RepID=A0A3N6S6M6_9GAMM|nr:C45 family peptidase [Erwinia psidii]MCX8966053.1 acyl-CoA--6-aminopenicillanic acid acyl-transferase [Erwinia psidii]RQM36700.1 acyl-CoA--6-aminopenicillanic acid acyl-transferase [Erwinia psidii]
MKKIDIRGSAFSVGQQLGESGRDAWHKKLTQTRLWQTVIGLSASDHIQAMRTAVIGQYPLIWQELQGMAQGLEAPLEEVFAWNCRGDLLRSTSDGCSTIAGGSATGSWVIAHNEDGFPQLREECALASITPDDGPAFLSFIYPGSIPGHTFSVNEKGIVNTVNNIRVLHRPAGLPRQVLARAALNASSLDEAILQLTSPVRAGAFHHTLAQMGDNRLFSVEATGAGCSVVQVTGTMGHSNHLIHAEMANVAQVITDSSAARQATLKILLKSAHPLNTEVARTILSDQSNAELPICRLSPQDPDDENTLATAVFDVGTRQIGWQIFGIDRHIPLFEGQTG